MLWLFKINFRRWILIHGNSSYVVLYTQCLRYNICSAWFLDIRISTCNRSVRIVAIIYCSGMIVDSVIIDSRERSVIHLKYFENCKNAKQFYYH